MRTASLAILICLLASACMSPPPTPRHTPVTVTTTFPARPPAPSSTAEGYPQLGGIAPGSLISATLFDTIDPRMIFSDATAWRLRYMTTSAIDGKPIESTGLVIVPGGTPPEGGWPVVAYNHGNTGIQPSCGPSQYDDMLNQWGGGTLLLYDFAVVMADYEGLGGPGTGTHSFLNAAAMGRNIIDAVRAARHLRPDIGTRWAAYGGSLGALATWGANEQASTYGTDLDLVGAAAWSPPVDVSTLPAKARAGTITRDQMHLYFLAIMSLKASTHPEMNLEDYLHGVMYENRDLLATCIGPSVREATKVIKGAVPSDLVPVNDEAERQMTEWLKRMAVPQQRAAAPMLVFYGTADQLVDQSWVETAIDRACELGDTVEWVKGPGEGHGDINADMAFPWTRARFAGQAPINKCLQGPIRPSGLK
jgi:hypothetical protein